jgi:large subunit ribosomal protein L2
MALKNYNPTTPGQRQLVTVDRSTLYKGKPVKTLTEGQHATGGRGNTGRITSRFRGGGHKQRYRIIDWKRNKPGVPARVASVQYDPNRTARIALLHYADGEKRYILAPDGVKVGDEVLSSRKADIKPGNTLPLRFIPAGTMVHALETKIGKGAQLVRAAGASAQLMAKEGDYAHIRLPSSEVRLVHLNCRATIGQVSNLLHARMSLGKAGRTRWLGRRPHNRGVSMNPVDHPMGGGEGRASGGHPRSRKGLLSKGKKTRHPKKYSDGLIIARRKK